MIKYVCIFLMAVQVQFSSTPIPTESQSRAASCEPTEFTEYDAERLIYLLPASMTTRNNGRKVGWELQSNPELNEKDFFIFYVYDLSAPDSGSPTIGYFAINKHTAEVWDMSAGRSVQSEDLLAVQKILRRGHCVDESVLKTYSSRRPDTK
jgi:hypothetical protein